MLAHSLMGSSKKVCLMTTHCYRQADLFLGATACPYSWALRLRLVGLTLQQARLLRVGDSLPASSPCAGVPDAASPLAGRRRGPGSMSNAESSGTAEASTADSLALVPLTPDDSHAPSLRRSSREHKKPRPYYAASQAEPPNKPPTKGLQRGYLK